MPYVLGTLYHGWCARGKNISEHDAMSCLLQEEGGSRTLARPLQLLLLEGKYHSLLSSAFFSRNESNLIIVRNVNKLDERNIIDTCSIRSSGS